MIASGLADQDRRSSRILLHRLHASLPLMSPTDLSDLPQPQIFTRDVSGASMPPALQQDAPGGASVPQGCSPPRVVAVGNFDGVHIGHAEIVSQLRSMASRLAARAVVLTFDPHPATLVRPDTAPPPLSTAIRRAELLLGLGIDEVQVQPLVRAIVNLSARDFFDRVLCGRMRAVGLVEGTDFHFGRGREGDVAMLARLCDEQGLAFDVVPPVHAGDAVVSSSRVRGLLATGDIGRATALLTAPYRISGTVIEGAKRGRTLGFPTANLADISTLLPAPGVYAADAIIAADDGLRAPVSRHPAAVHIGANVSFGETTLSVEVHLIGFAGSLYGHSLHVDFRQRLRDTHRFASREALVSQLKADVQQAAEACSKPIGSFSRSFPSPPHLHAS
jgi:riboflavin kinase/FMN adenylyltransferase